MMKNSLRYLSAARLRTRAIVDTINSGLSLSEIDMCEMFDLMQEIQGLYSSAYSLISAENPDTETYACGIKNYLDIKISEIDELLDSLIQESYTPKTNAHLQDFVSGCNRLSNTLTFLSKEKVTNPEMTVIIFSMHKNLFESAHYIRNMTPKQLSCIVADADTIWCKLDAYIQVAKLETPSENVDKQALRLHNCKDTLNKMKMLEMSDGVVKDLLLEFVAISQDVLSFMCGKNSSKEK